MKIILISDIHANLTALEAILAHASAHYGEETPIAQLGDLINYGMRPNETLEKIDSLKSRLLVHLAGNHEMASLGLGVERFKSPRGRQSLEYTLSILDKKWLHYFKTQMASGPFVLEVKNRKLLFVHGNLSDPLWGGMTFSEMSNEAYCDYDYVISGHSHRPKMMEIYFSNTQSPKARRGQSKTIFINPGSVGQPRNHNTSAQYGVLDLDSGSTQFNAVAYNIEKETSLYKGEIDNFYCERLRKGV